MSDIMQKQRETRGLGVSRPGGEYMGLFCPHLEDVDAVEGRQRQSDHLGWELLSRLYPHLDVMTFSE